MERLQKVIANLGYCSRRHAEYLISQGKVLVNGEKTKATYRAKGVCLCCGAEVIAKCGLKLVWHWAHKNKEECLAVIACGYPHGFNCNLTAFTGVGMHRIAEKAVTNWVNSPGHFQTMVNAACDTLGVGVTIDNSRAFCYMMVGNPNAYNPYG